LRHVNNERLPVVRHGLRCGPAQFEPGAHSFNLRSRFFQCRTKDGDLFLEL
jgi:hypothetical protein